MEMKIKNSKGKFIPNNLPKEEIITLYKNGMFQREIAEKFQVSQSCISNILIKSCSTISRSEVNRKIWKRMSVFERYAQVEAAHNAARNRKRTYEEKIQKAKNVQENQKLSDNEQKFLKVFTESKIYTQPLYALDIYNIDLAIPERKIAIEIDGGNWHNSEKKKKQDTGKEVLLRSHGWILIRIKTHRRLTTTVDYTNVNIADIINAIYSNSSIFEKYGLENQIKS